MRQIPMVGKSIQTGARTSLVILAWSLPSMFASGTDTLSFGIKLRSSQREQASPSRANSRIPLIEMLGDIWVGVSRACNCEAEKDCGLHLVPR